jgi:outer membrane lipoprotein LolB
MRAIPGARSAPVLALVLFLSACSSMPPASPDAAQRQALYQERHSYLAARDSWTLKARLAINNSDDGGSGVLNWSRDEAGQRMDFHGALGRGAWRLEAGEMGAVLTQSDGEVLRSDTVDELVRDQLGNEVPVSALAWWIRGLAAPGKSERLVLDEGGRPSGLSQDGWQIEFERYRDFAGQQLPQRITARQGEWTIKLAIREWSLAPALALP